MRLVIDVTPTIQNHAGLGRYAGELAQALLATCPPNEQLELFYTDSQQRQPPMSLITLPRIALKLPNKLWRLQVLLAHLLYRSQDNLVGHGDVFLATDHLLPYFSTTMGVFVLHDLTFKLYPSVHLPLNRWFLKLMVPHFLKSARAIVAVSECTKRDAVSSYQLPADKISVIYEGVNQRFQSIDLPGKLQSIRDRYNLPPQFLLYLGTIEPRKNLLTVLEAFQQILADLPGLQLIIAGKKGWLYKEILTKIQVLNLAERVQFTGFVPDEDLPVLYNLATVFVFPSFYEGFGLPVLEAMACGAPVLCSNTSSLPEVAGEAAILINPNDVRGWAQAMAQVIKNETLRDDLIQRGFRQAARFTWEATARQTRQLYRELYAHRP